MNEKQGRYVGVEEERGESGVEEERWREETWREERWREQQYYCPYPVLLLLLNHEHPA